MNREEAVRKRRLECRRESVVRLVEGTGDILLIGGATAGYIFGITRRADLALALGMGAAAVTGMFCCRKMYKEK
jgi:hypothetical protein